MSSKYDWINCEEMTFKVSLLRPLDCAILLCEVGDEADASEIESNSDPIGEYKLDRIIYKHPYISCIETYSRLVAEGMERGEIPYGRNSAIPADDHVAHPSRRISGQALCDWIEKAHPALQAKLPFTNRRYADLEQELAVAAKRIEELEALLAVSEAEILSSKTDGKHPSTERADLNRTILIGLLVKVILDRDVNQIGSVYLSQNDIAEKILSPGFANVNFGEKVIKDRFAEANKALEDLNT